MLHRHGDRVVRVLLPTSRASRLHVTAPSGRPRSELDGAFGRHGWSFALGALLVVAPGMAGGGYAPRTWVSLTLVYVAIAGLGLSRPRPAHLSRSAYAELGLLAVLAAWTAASAIWAVDGAAPSVEARRCLLYAVGLLAVLAHVRRRTRITLLAGLVGGLLSLAGLGVVERSFASGGLDPFYGSLLREPVGYPNGLGVLMGTGLVLSCGLAHLRTSVPGTSAWLTAAAAVFVLVLALTGSRGAALATAIGAIAWLAHERWRQRLGTLAVAVAAGLLPWLVTSTPDRGPALLVGSVAAAALLGRGLAPWAPALGRHPLALIVVCGLVGAGALAVTGSPSTSSSMRLEYWDVAVETSAAHPLLGAGAGSFAASWVARRDVASDVRDAHSLYLEVLSELGPLGLALVLALVVLPSARALRGRRDDVDQLAFAAFLVLAVHAGIDWDWELPVVALAAFALAGVLLARRDADPVTGT